MAELMQSSNQPDSILHRGADIGLDTSSCRQEVQRRDGQSPKDIPLPPQIPSHLTRCLAGDQMFTMPLRM